MYRASGPMTLAGSAFGFGLNFTMHPVEQFGDVKVAVTGFIADLIGRRRASPPIRIEEVE